MQSFPFSAAGGDLHKHCLEIEAVRTEKEICSLIYQIVEAASYLHENHVVHLDLKVNLESTFLHHVFLSTSNGIISYCLHCSVGCFA